MLKFMYLAKRKPTLSPEAFTARWRQHGALAMSLSFWRNMLLYVQADPIRPAPIPSASGDYDAVAITKAQDDSLFTNPSAESGADATKNIRWLRMNSALRSSISAKTLPISSPASPAVRAVERRQRSPDSKGRWRVVESVIEEQMLRYAYEEVHLPIMEFTELYSRGVGEATDIVEKEMYSFPDRDCDSLTLRPEGTAGCVRMLQQHGMLFNQTQRVFYRGPMFRYERPQ